MAFYGANFIYDSVISSEYGLRITSGTNDLNYSGASVELLTQSLYRRPKPYLLGVQQTPVLSFPVHFNVSSQLSGEESSVISKWLFGQMNYKKLQIVQSDMQYIYYSCIFVNPQIERVGNVIRGYEATAICDSPFAWEYPKTLTYDYASSYSVDDDIVINNTSDNADYTYPSISFTINLFGGSLSITNSDDNDREFLFSNLSPNEVITIDNDIQSITSSLGVNRLANFNYKWFRYVPKINNLNIQGNISSISFTHSFAKKIL